MSQRDHQADRGNASAALESLKAAERQVPRPHEAGLVRAARRGDELAAAREAVWVIRRAARQQPVELASLPAAGDPMLAVDIQDVLSRLAPNHQAVLLLRGLAGLRERSAAALLRVPAGTVKSRLARARASFRREWQASRGQ